MALLVDKDIAVGEPHHVYLRVYPYFTPMNGGIWKLDVKVDFSKWARTLKGVQDFLQWRIGTTSVEVKYNKKVAQRLSIAEDAWASVMGVGPWDDPEEMEYVLRTYIQVPVRTVQEYSLYYYVAEKPVGVPEVADADAFSAIYAGVKNVASPLFAAIESPQLKKKDTVESIEDDYESVGDMIARVIETDPALGKLAPGEKELPPLPNWTTPSWQ